MEKFLISTYSNFVLLSLSDESEHSSRHQKSSAEFYTNFWSLQEFFSKPFQLWDATSWATFVHVNRPTLFLISKLRVFVSRIPIKLWTCSPTISWTTLKRSLRQTTPSLPNIWLAKRCVSDRLVAANSLLDAVRLLLVIGASIERCDISTEYTRSISGCFSIFDPSRQIQTNTADSSWWSIAMGEEDHPSNQWSNSLRRNCWYLTSASFFF